MSDSFDLRAQTLKEPLFILHVLIQVCLHVFVQVRDCACENLPL
jgi:hypothetical protein